MTERPPGVLISSPPWIFLDSAEPGETGCATLMICLSSDTLVGAAAEDVGVKVADVVIKICLFFM